MSGLFKVGMRRRVAPETCSVDLICACLSELHYLSNVTTGIDVGFARPVAAFAGYPFARMQQCKTGMWVGAEFLDNFAVAGLAGFRTNNVGGIEGDRCGRCDILRLARNRSLRVSGLTQTAN